MKIWTLWHRGDELTMPWLLDAYDEYTLEENGEVPPNYRAKLDGKGEDLRELVIEIPEGVVRALFEPKVIKAATWVDPERAEAARQQKAEDAKRGREE